MGLNTWIKDRIRLKISPNPGIVSTPTDDEEYPSFIANEGMGGSHSYRTLLELADIPKDRLVDPMIAIVKGVGVLKFDPTLSLWNTFINTDTYNKISDIPGYDINDYWKPAFDPTPGPQGEEGPVGWSPILGVVTRDSTNEVLRVIDWVNNDGADISTKPAVGQYLTNTGFSNNIALAKNIKGATGAQGNGGQATGGTKYTQSFMQNRNDLWVSGIANVEFPGGALGRIYDPVDFTTPSESNLKVKYNFKIQLTGDSSSIDQVRVRVQRTSSPFTTWADVPGSGILEVVLVSESNVLVNYDGIDNNTSPSTAYRYRIIAYNTAGGNSRFSTDFGHVLHLTFG